jgi:beta-aspartyl-peptidase (threonine type)
MITDHPMRCTGCGAVTNVTGVRHPVLAARMVMEKTPHVFIQGPEATALAAEHGLEVIVIYPG